MSAFQGLPLNLKGSGLGEALPEGLFFKSLRLLGGSIAVRGTSTVASSDLAGSATALRGAESSTQLQYVAAIDGLRAVSILAVVAYHVGVPGVPGGFIGVDIFFVISGFLIINQIKAALSSGQFSIFSFYAQRALRILPPFLIVLLATYAVPPFFVSTTAEYWDFFASATLAPLMVTNVLFYLTQGYFDISSIEKPLLHTWTLSVEEQFYFLAPILLALVFRLGNRRFGFPAAILGIALLALSLTGAITHTFAAGRNPAFYLPQWRAWEFLIGGFISAQLIEETRRLPRAFTEFAGCLGAVCIGIAIATFNESTLYPSSNAVLPSVGAALIILSVVARPESTLARLLSLRWVVAIGLVSYGWYLWHWPILSYLRMARLDEPSFLIDSCAAGALAFALACVSYLYIETPIRRWRKAPGRLKNPRRIVFGSIAACTLTALLGGMTALGGYMHTDSVLASHYGVQGKGVLDNGCESKKGFAESCFDGPVGVLVGDSHATVLAGPFAKRFDALGVRLVSLARGSCGPLLLAASKRTHDRADDCVRLTAPFERLLARPVPLEFAIITGIWGYDDSLSERLSELISGFDQRTRILLIGPTPTFAKSSLECVVLSDWYVGNRDRCVRPRSEVEPPNEAAVKVLKMMPARFPNVRYIDVTDIFCGQTLCSPFSNNDVFYSDTHHLTVAGADRIYDSFETNFLWLAGKETNTFSGQGMELEE